MTTAGRGTVAAALALLASSAWATDRATPRAAPTGQLADAQEPSATPSTPSKAVPAAPGSAASPQSPPGAQSATEPPAAPQPDVWSPQEIAAGVASCVALLKGLDVVVIPAEPIKAGECGTPAPVQLVSLGKNPQVAISPPATLTCDMVAALHTWVAQDLQPLARRYLSAPLIRIESMSSYSCRAALGRAKTRLSEHGRANALDIGAFMTATADGAHVLADWGPTHREILAQIAAAKAAEEKAAAERAAAAAATIGRGQPTSPPGQPPAAAAVEPPKATAAGGAPPPAGTIIEGVPGMAPRFTGIRPATDSSTLGLSSPNRLGGPGAKMAEPQPPSPPVRDHKLQFLRAAHAAACRIFGTVLGPEANNAHKNHFHIDMAERKSGRFCE